MHNLRNGNGSLSKDRRKDPQTTTTTKKSTFRQKKANSWDIGCSVRADFTLRCHQLSHRWSGNQTKWENNTSRKSTPWKMAENSWNYRSKTSYFNILHKELANRLVKVALILTTLYTVCKKRTHNEGCHINVEENVLFPSEMWWRRSIIKYKCHRASKKSPFICETKWLSASFHLLWPRLHFSGNHRE